MAGVAADQRRGDTYLMSGGHRGVCRDLRSVPGGLGRDGIDSYDFTLQIVTELLYGTYQISVVDGTPVSVERLEGLFGPDVDVLEIPELPKTIDAVFDQLEREVAGDDFDAEFDDEFGYPTHVFVDRIADAVDDELEFFISDFTITTTTTAGPSQSRRAARGEHQLRQRRRQTTRCWSCPNDSPMTRHHQ